MTGSLVTATRVGTDYWYWNLDDFFFFFFFFVFAFFFFFFFNRSDRPRMCLDLSSLWWGVIRLHRYDGGRNLFIFFFFAFFFPI